MKNILTLASVAMLLAACGGAPDDGSSVGDSGSQGQSPDTQILEYTADLRASKDFNFETSRSIAIDFDVEAARVTEGLLSLCTDYSKSGEQYDVNYDSCTVQTPLVNGLYNSDMKVTNDISSVVGVIWFKDANYAPIFKEFSLEVGAKVARRGGGPQSIVWR